MAQTNRLSLSWQRIYEAFALLYPGYWRLASRIERFRKWENGTEKGCLWSKGIPGSGKSVFAASTVKTLAETQDCKGNSAPTLFFFFRQIVEKNHDPKYLVRDWAAQLLPSSVSLRAKLHDLSKQSKECERSNM